MGDSLEEARARMIAKRFGGNSQGASTGGGGSARRKKKAVHKAGGSDDKKIGSTLKKLGCSPITGIEEVNIFRDNNEVIHFKNPKVQAAIHSNLFVINGAAESKSIEEMLPQIYNQLGASDMASLSKMLASQAAAAGSGGQLPKVDEDEEIPDLVDNFEEVSKS